MFIEILGIYQLFIVYERWDSRHSFSLVLGRPILSHVSGMPSLPDIIDGGNDINCGLRLWKKYYWWIKLASINFVAKRVFHALVYCLCLYFPALKGFAWWCDQVDCARQEWSQLRGWPGFTMHLPIKLVWYTHNITVGIAVLLDSHPGDLVVSIPSIFHILRGE